MKKIILPLAAMLLAIAPQAYAQDTAAIEEVQVKISREVDGEMKYFEKSYPSEEAMREDKELQAFIGKENAFRFDPPPAPPHPRVWEPNGNMVFHFDGDSLMKNLKILQDSGGYAFSYHMENMDEHFEDMKVEINKQMEHLRDMDFEIVMPDMDSVGKNIEVIVSKLSDSNFPPAPARKMKISVEVDAFGKAAKLKDDERLELNELSLVTTPSGKLRVRLTTAATKADLSLTVEDQDQRQLFQQVTPSFSGRFSQSLDLSNYEAGTYLLTIRHGDKKLLRSVTIE